MDEFALRSRFPEAREAPGSDHSHSLGSTSSKSSVLVFVFPSALTFYADDPTSHKQILTIWNPYHFSLNFQVLSTAPNHYVVTEPTGKIPSRFNRDIIIKHVKPHDEKAFDVEHKFLVQVSEAGKRKVIGQREITAVLVASDDSGLGASTSGRHHNVAQRRRRNSSDLGGYAGRGRFSQTFPEGDSASLSPGGSIRRPPSLSAAGSSPNYLAISVGVLCILCLSFPTARDHSSHTPSPSRPSGGTPAPGDPSSQHTTTPPQSEQPIATTTHATIASHIPEYLHLTVTQKLVAAYVLGVVSVILVRGS